MKELTWPLTVVLIAVIAALAFMFDNAQDSAVQSQILGHFDSIIPALFGAAGGAVVGFSFGFLRGKAII